MKNIKKYTLIILGFAALSSCKDFLEVTPQGQLTDKAYFNNEQAINDAVSRVYSSVNWRFFRLGTMYFNSHEFPSDDVRMNTTDGSFTTVNNFTNDPGNIYIERLWERWYQYINDCNQVLELTKNYDGEQVNKYNAQARYFRAFYHFDLINVFGEAVKRDHVPTPEEYNIPKSTEEELYKLVIEDLEYAIQYLPTRSEWGVANNGRVTKGTAKGLLAKVYLYRGDYTNAYKYANEVVNLDNEYSLDPNYRNLFSKQGKYSVESMMPGHYIFQNITGRVRNPYVEFQGIPGSGLGSAIFVPSDNLVNSYEAGDPRKTAAIFEKGETIPGYSGALNWAQGFQYANKKVIFPANEWPTVNDFFSQELNLPFLRFADIVLILAEAANELPNKQTEARQALEKIRYRARGNKTFAEAGVLPEISTNDQNLLRQAIWNERRIELALEGNRWFDLVRYEKVVPNYTTNLLHSLGKTNFNYAKHSKFPIPSTHITSSNNVLEQNDSWK